MVLNDAVTKAPFRNNRILAEMMVKIYVKVKRLSMPPVIYTIPVSRNKS
jgi:hypothetical protein